MEILIVMLCGLFIMITGIISYYKMSYDFEVAIKEKNREGEKR